jgi:hypothetical protein
MSFLKSLKKIEKSLRPAGNIIKAGIASFIPGGAAAVAIRDSAVNLRQSAAFRQPSALQLNTSGYGDHNVSLINNMASLPAIMRTGAAVLPGVGASTVGGGVVRGVAGSVARRIGRYAGGAVTAASVGAMIYDAAGNPIGRRARRRGKGITASQLKAFTRVTHILNKYCKTPAPARRRSTGARKCR